jgi:hypothetical protein
LVPICASLRSGSGAAFVAAAVGKRHYLQRHILDRLDMIDWPDESPGASRSSLKLSAMLCPHIPMPNEPGRFLIGGSAYRFANSHSHAACNVQGDSATEHHSHRPH